MATQVRRRHVRDNLRPRETRGLNGTQPSHGRETPVVARAMLQSEVETGAPVIY